MDSGTDIPKGGANVNRKDSGDLGIRAYGAVMLYIITVNSNVYMDSQCSLKSSLPETQPKTYIYYS